MSVQPKSKSFFSTTAGLITGIAGVLTAVVGAFGAANQLGWFGSKDDSSSTTTTTTASTATTRLPGVAGGLLPTTTPPAPGAAAAGGTTSFTVTPSTLDFSPTSPRDASVKVENTGRAAIAFDAPTVAGVNARNFTATPVDATCSRLDAGRSCQIKVTFAPSGPGSYSAVVAIRPQGAPAREVTLKGNSLL